MNLHSGAVFNSRIPRYLWEEVRDYGVREVLGMIVGRDSVLFLNLASYSIECENNSGWYYSDYAYNNALFRERMRIYSDAKVSKFLLEKTRDQSVWLID